jgi:pyruvate/2-oxoglutarate dehydrogenase complex dihydrolipoamide dehydrogenase (E3) component
MATSIRTPFDFSSTADDVIEGIDLSGRRAIVTGGSSGIGVETARALASTGAEVTLAVRRTAAGDQVAAELVRSTGNEAISCSRWSCPTSGRSRSSSNGGPGRCTFW